jgi:hypothetical protein
MWRDVFGRVSPGDTGGAREAYRLVIRRRPFLRAPAAALTRRPACRIIAASGGVET